MVLAGSLKDVFIVTGGLNAGDRIVTEGAISLRNDTEIKPVMADHSGALPENQSSPDGAPGKTNN